MTTEEETARVAANETYWNELISEGDAADFVSLTPRGLQAFRLRGEGPSFIRISRRCIRYRRSDLRIWLDGLRVDPVHVTENV